MVVQTTTLSIGGMACDSCVRHVSRALDGMIGVLEVQVDLKGACATVEHLPDWADEISLIAAIKDAGYAARATARDIYADAD